MAGIVEVKQLAFVAERNDDNGLQAGELPAPITGRAPRDSWRLFAATKSLAAAWMMRRSGRAPTQDPDRLPRLQPHHRRNAPPRYSMPIPVDRTPVRVKRPVSPPGAESSRARGSFLASLNGPR